MGNSYCDVKRDWMTEGDMQQIYNYPEVKKPIMRNDGQPKQSHHHLYMCV